jgi:myotubularin-related protein 3/4
MNFVNRPKANAFGNRAKGAGYEHAEYSNCKLEFAGIANIHAMRDSLNKLHDCCNSPNEENFYSQLESSRWFEVCVLTIISVINPFLHSIYRPFSME